MDHDGLVEDERPRALAAFSPDRATVALFGERRLRLVQ